jgi:hypothetical protein
VKAPGGSDARSPYFLPAVMAFFERGGVTAVERQARALSAFRETRDKGRLRVKRGKDGRGRTGSVAVFGLFLGRLEDLERAQQRVVDAHHRAGIVELVKGSMSASLRSWHSRQAGRRTSPQ